MRAPIPPYITAMAVGLDVVIVAAYLGSLPWLALGAFAMACGVIDGLRLSGVTFSRVVSDALECLVVIAVFLVLCLFKPSDSDAPNELD